MRRFYCNINQIGFFTRGSNREMMTISELESLRKRWRGATSPSDQHALHGPTVQALSKLNPMMQAAPVVQSLKGLLAHYASNHLWDARQIFFTCKAG